MGLGGAVTLLGLFGPGISGLVCTRLEKGTDGIKELSRRIFAWRVDWKVYLLAILVPFLIAFLPLVLFAVMGGPAPSFENLVRVPFLFPALLATILVGGISEEPGWRGFALPVLRARHGSLVASLLIGIFWGIWHVPLYAMGSPILVASLIGFIVLTTIISTLFTALANFTRDSVWVAILFHAAYNTFILNLPDLLNVRRVPQHQMIAVLLVVALVFLVLWWWRRTDPPLDRVGE